MAELAATANGAPWNALLKKHHGTNNTVRTGMHRHGQLCRHHTIGPCAASDIVHRIPRRTWLQCPEVLQQRFFQLSQFWVGGAGASPQPRHQVSERLRAFM